MGASFFAPEDLNVHYSQWFEIAPMTKRTKDVRPQDNILQTPSAKLPSRGRRLENPAPLLSPVRLPFRHPGATCKCLIRKSILS